MSETSILGVPPLVTVEPRRRTKTTPVMGVELATVRSGHLDGTVPRWRNNGVEYACVGDASMPVDVDRRRGGSRFNLRYWSLRHGTTFSQSA